MQVPNIAKVKDYYLHIGKCRQVLSMDCDWGLILMRCACLISAAPMLLVTSATASISRQPVSVAEQARWIQHVIPLPKQIRIEQKIRIPPSQVMVRTREGAGRLEREAARRLLELLRSKGAPEAGAPIFEIVVGVCDKQGHLADIQVPAARRLPELPNREQAYVIEPIGDDAIALAALDEPGVFYAARTLYQLIERKFRRGELIIPLAHVLDWPDLAERGEWGGSSTRDIEWLASQKMNLVEAHVGLHVTPDGKATAEIDPELLERGRLNAVKVVPIITHLDQLQRTGIYDVYPELMGKGDSARAGRVIAPCFSQPKMGEIIAGWIRALAAHEGVTDICAWLSEMHVQCGCEGCRQAGQYVLEARALVNGWRQAVKKYPNLRLRILLTQGSYDSNDKVLAEVPPEVGVTYYHGGRTYNSSRDPMIYPLLEDYAAKGRWLGCYPQLTASWRIVCPWSGPQFIKYRMTEFVDKGLKCLCGYATPDNRLYDFNVTAAAEWSWNAHGRTEKEFAEAWAIRRRIKHPEQVAQWAVMLGPVGWDVYGSGVPYPHFFGHAAKLVKDKTRPVLGEGCFRYFPSAEHIEEDITTCEKAFSTARQIGDPKLIAESEVIGGYVKMLREIYTIADLVSREEKPSDDVRRKLQEAMSMLVKAEMQTTSALEAWERACSDNNIGTSRFTDTVDVTHKTAADIGRVLARLGIRDPAGPFRLTEVGTWESDDFEKNESIRKTWEITDFVAGDGTYRVQFAHESGWWGLNISRAALASASKAYPTKLHEISADEHAGVAGYRNKANVYTLTLHNYDENLRYFLIADIKGTRSSDKPESQRGCNGSVTLQKVREDKAQ